MRLTGPVDQRKINFHTRLPPHAEDSAGFVGLHVGEDVEAGFKGWGRHGAFIAADVGGVAYYCYSHVVVAAWLVGW